MIRQLQSSISMSGNTISVGGDTSPGNVKTFISHLYNIIELRGHSDVTIDFKSAQSVFEGFILPIIATANKYILSGVSFRVILPKDDRLKALFLNANWAHLLDPETHPPSTYGNGLHVPAIQFVDADQQYAAVDKIMDTIIGGLDTLNRGHLKSIYWALTELTDNVLNHSLSKVGGFVQASTFRNNNSVEFVVADAGVGIPKTLGISDPRRALEQAIQEGVTRDKKTNAGNGLFGSYRVAVLSNGSFEIQSLKGSLYSNTSTGTKIENSIIPYIGTYIRCVIKCDNQNLLDEALRFNNKPHDPAFDYVEQQFEGEGSEFIFKMREQTNSFGSREHGISVGNKMRNLIRDNTCGMLIVDFDGVLIISSSFADEVFGRIFLELGPIKFMNKIKIVNADQTIMKLIDRAIMQRATSA